jgi:hypothetical protein
MNLSAKHYVIILSALATAILHVSLFPDIMFMLNGSHSFVKHILPIAFFQERTGWSGGHWRATPC